jgi:hypothetical protein
LKFVQFLPLFDAKLAIDTADVYVNGIVRPVKTDCDLFLGQSLKK